MGLGGPVWDASVAPVNGRPRREELRRLALLALAGVGDAGQEWHEWTGRAYHVRRRLTAAEQEHVGPAVDCRGGEEARGRLSAARTWLRQPFRAMAARETGL